MQFQVPQFIEAEDKIVGPLSLREFMYIGAAGGTSLLLYFMVNLSFWIIIAPLIMGIGLALGLVKVNGRHLPEIARAALKFYWYPQVYLWQPEGAITDKEGQLKAFVGKKIQLPTEPRATTKFERPAQQEISLDRIVSGFALRNAWEKLQTGGPRKKISPNLYEDRYEIYQRLSGEQRAAKRVDYTT